VLTTVLKKTCKELFFVDDERSIAKYDLCSSRFEDCSKLAARLFENVFW